MAQRTLIEKPEPLYPGAPILLSRFIRDGELGDVRVQQYTPTAFRVAQFLPGRVTDLPGDTPKVEPEVHQWVKTFDEAVEVFDRYRSSASEAGWKEEDDA